MIPMRNRHNGLTCRGLHKLRERGRSAKNIAVYKNGLFSFERLEAKGGFEE